MPESSSQVQDQPASGDVAVVSAPPSAALEGEALRRAVEAVLLTLERPTSTLRLAEGFGLVRVSAPSEGAASQAGGGVQESKPRRRKRVEDDSASALAAIDRAIGELNEEYERTGRTFRIQPVAGGWRLMTVPAMAGIVAAFHSARVSSKLSRASIETLAIIAYKQPITRAHLEAIRGVSCGEVLRSLMDRRLITIAGRAEELGRPILYGTTREFLDAFGLASLKDLPSAAELHALP